MSTFCKVLTVASIVLAGLLFLYVWPFSRPALLIPLAWWTMYVIDKWHCTAPVLGLIDFAAEKMGYDPIPSVRVKQGEPLLAPKPAAPAQPAIALDDSSASVV
jgi:hypothetical protein